MGISVNTKKSQNGTLNISTNVSPIGLDKNAFAFVWKRFYYKHVVALEETLLKTSQFFYYIKSVDFKSWWDSKLSQ